jgi:hypothetical protein
MTNACSNPDNFARNIDKVTESSVISQTLWISILSALISSSILIIFHFDCF